MIIWFRKTPGEAPIKLPAAKQAVFLSQAGYLAAAIVYPGQGIWLESRLTGDVDAAVKNLGLDLMQLQVEGAVDPRKLTIQVQFESDELPVRQSDLVNAWISDEYGQPLLIAEAKSGRIRMVQLNTDTDITPLASELVPNFQRAPQTQRQVTT